MLRSSDLPILLVVEEGPAMVVEGDRVFVAETRRVVDYCSDSWLGVRTAARLAGICSNEHGLQQHCARGLIKDIVETTSTILVEDNTSRCLQRSRAAWLWLDSGRGRIRGPACGGEPSLVSLVSLVSGQPWRESEARQGPCHKGAEVINKRTTGTEFFN